MVVEKSAGGLVCKREKGEVLWLIRRPTPNPNYRGNLGWSFPKGLIDPGEALEQAAIREVKEEGGVMARIVCKLPTIRTFFTNSSKEKVMKFITYFVMEYESDHPKGHDWETAEVRWVTSGQAEDLLAFTSERKLLEQAGKMLE